MQKKQFYEAPEAEVLKVKFERNFCVSPYDNTPDKDYRDNPMGSLDDDRP